MNFFTPPPVTSLFARELEKSETVRRFSFGGTGVRSPSLVTDRTVEEIYSVSLKRERSTRSPEEEKNDKLKKAKINGKKQIVSRLPTKN